MKKIEKLKTFTKRLIVNISTQVLPEPAQLIYKVAKDFYEIFIVAHDVDRQDLIEAACDMSDVERVSFIQDIKQQFGQNQAQAIDGVLSTLRVRPQVENALEQINHTMLSNSHNIIHPANFSAHQSMIGSAVVSSMLHIQSPLQEPIAEHSNWPQIEGFEIKYLLGKGNFSEVYLAHELNDKGELKRSCALKVGKLHSLKRFHREISALHQIRHENLVDYYGSGLLPDQPPRFWITMPNYGGVTLSDLMRDTLNLEQKFIVSKQILNGLYALHSKRIAHRDLKPENILITNHYMIKLADFGLSKYDRVDNHKSLVSMNSTLLGTPAYMSPEQVKGRPSGMQSDVWTFGIILYELFVGHVPFLGNVGEIIGKIQYEDIQWDHKKIPSLFQSVIQKCLQRDLSDRYISAIELSQDFTLKTEQWDHFVRHEHLRVLWRKACEQDSFLKFVQKYAPHLPLDASQVFIITFPQFHELDGEKLNEILLTVSKAYQDLMDIRHELEVNEIDWNSLITQAEQQALETLAMQSAHEINDQMIEETKKKSRDQIFADKLVHDHMMAEIRTRLLNAETVLSQVNQAVLQRELSDYQRIFPDSTQLDEEQLDEEELQNRGHASNGFWVVSVIVIIWIGILVFLFVFFLYKFIIPTIYYHLK